MRDWIIIVILYVLAVGGFRSLGGLRSAGEAFRRWGAHGGSSRTQPGSSS